MTTADKDKERKATPIEKFKKMTFYCDDPVMQQTGEELAGLLDLCQRSPTEIRSLKQLALSEQQSDQFKNIVDLSSIRTDPDKALSEGIEKKDRYLIMLALYYGAKVYDSWQKGPILLALRNNNIPLAMLFTSVAIANNSLREMLETVVVGAKLNWEFLEFFIRLFDKPHPEDIEKRLASVFCAYVRCQISEQSLSATRNIPVLAEQVFVEPRLGKIFSHDKSGLLRLIEILLTPAFRQIYPKNIKDFVKILDAFHDVAGADPSTIELLQAIKPKYKSYFTKFILGGEELYDRERLPAFLLLPEWLLDLNALISDGNSVGETPLTMSCQSSFAHEFPRLEKLLENKNVNINKRNARNQTPLIAGVCAHTPNPLAIQALLNKNPDLSAKSLNFRYPRETEKTALEWAEFLRAQTKENASLDKIVAYLRLKQASPLASMTLPSGLSSQERRGPKDDKDAKGHLPRGPSSPTHFKPATAAPGAEVIGGPGGPPKKVEEPLAQGKKDDSPCVVM